VPIYDPEHRWFGVALAGFGFVYNKRVLTLNRWPEIATWRELGSAPRLGRSGPVTRATAAAST